VAPRAPALRGLLSRADTWYARARRLLDLVTGSRAARAGELAAPNLATRQLDRLVREGLAPDSPRTCGRPGSARRHVLRHRRGAARTAPNASPGRDRQRREPRVGRERSAPVRHHLHGAHARSRRAPRQLRRRAGARASHRLPLPLELTDGAAPLASLAARLAASIRRRVPRLAARRDPRPPRSSRRGRRSRHRGVRRGRGRARRRGSPARCSRRCASRWRAARSGSCSSRHAARRGGCPRRWVRSARAEATASVLFERSFLAYYRVSTRRWRRPTCCGRSRANSRSTPPSACPSSSRGRSACTSGATATGPSASARHSTPRTRAPPPPGSRRCSRRRTRRRRVGGLHADLARRHAPILGEVDG